MRVVLLCLLAFHSSAFGWIPKPYTPGPHKINLLSPGQSLSALCNRISVEKAQTNSVRPRSFLSRIKAGLFDAVFGAPKANNPSSEAVPDRPSKASIWEEATDPSTGAKYYWNRETGATSWDRPADTDPTPSASSAAPSGATLPAAAAAGEAGGSRYAMPNLYNGWFAGSYTYMGADGETERAIVGTDEVAQQFIAAVNRALADGLTRLEVRSLPGPGPGPRPRRRLFTRRRPCAAGRPGARGCPGANCDTGLEIRNLYSYRRNH